MSTQIHVNNHKAKTANIYQLFAVATIIIFGLISIIFGIDVMYLSALIIWLFSMLYVFSDLKRRSLYLVFLVSYFVFLLGGHFCYEYFGMEIKYYFSEEYYFHSNLCLFESLIFALGGHALSEHTRIKASLNDDSIFYRLEKSFDDGKVKSIRKISQILFIATFPFWTYTIMDKISFVLSNTYYAYYAEYESSAPFVVRAVAAMTPYFFYLFLATLPSKKECRVPMTLYFVYAVISLFTGRRSNFVIMILFLVLYFIFRHFRDDGEKWIKKSYVVSLLIGVPLMSVFLQITQYLRVSESFSGTSAKELFLAFFQQQGFSSSILRLEKYYESSLRDDAYYSFFGIVKYFRTNSIIKLFFNPQYDFSYLHNSVEFATRGNSLSNALSYKVLRTYLSGAGVGTCYIAELFHDFSYVGVAIGSIVYGGVMQKINKFWNSRRNNIWIMAVGFAMVEAFIKAPRWNYDIFVAYFLDLGMWMAFGSVFIVYKLLHRK